MTSTIALIFLVVACFQVNLARAGMDCDFDSTGSAIIDRLTGKTCPPFVNSDKEYCCIDLEHRTHYCCTAEEFAVKTGLTIIVPLVIGLAVIVCMIACCISCLCCSCCPWYRRRHPGVIYGKVQTPNVVHVIQTPANASRNYTSQPVSQNLYTPAPTSAPGMPQPPPQYTNEAYSKQAPYNPNYTQPQY